MRRNLSLQLFVGLALTACPPPPGTPIEAGPPDSPGAGDSVSLAIGESAEISGLTVTFNGVDGDNRCPKTVQCFVGGQAGVLLTVEDASGRAAELKIDVPPDGTAGGSFGDHEITVDLEPETKPSEAIDPDSYVATITVKRAAGGSA